MALRRRVVVCLDVKDGRVVKGTRFVGLRDVGDPVELARRYEAEGADEVVFLDVSASAEGRGTLLDVVRRTAEALFIPLTVGGGVRTAADVGPLLRAGADPSQRDTLNRTPREIAVMRGFVDIAAELAPSPAGGGDVSMARFLRDR